MLLRTILSYFLCMLVAVVFFIPTIIFLLMPEKIRYSSPFLYKWVDLFYRSILKCTFLPISYHGLENLPDGPAIFAANHQSSLDIPLVGSLARGIPHIWLAKYELLDSMFLRIVLPRMSVLVDTSSRQKSMRSLLTVFKLINNA